MSNPTISMNQFQRKEEPNRPAEETTEYFPSQASPLLSPDHSQRQSLVFGKVALALRDRLTSVRDKRKSDQTLVPSTPHSPELEKDDAEAMEPVDKLQRSIRVLRCVQGLITSSLSILIAIFQGKAYWTYLKTKDVPGAWPKTPALFPTLLLFSVAVMAFAFDIFMLVAYLTPDRGIAAAAYALANKAHYVAVTGKTASYAIVSVVCKSGFNFGNSSGTNSDIWSWTCSAKGEQFNNVTQAASNCHTQTLAWIFAMANAAIEVLGAIISLLMTRTKETAGAQSAVMSPKEQREKMDSMYDDIDGQLKDVTPNIQS